MNNVDICELVFPLLKLSASTASYNALCKVNKLFYKEFNTERIIRFVDEWFCNYAKLFLRNNTSNLFRNSIRVNNFVQVSFLTGRKDDAEIHHCLISFNDDNTITMRILTGEYNYDESFSAYVTRTFPNIKSLEMLKSIFRVNKFNSVQTLKNKTYCVSDFAEMYDLTVDGYYSFGINQ